MGKKRFKNKTRPAELKNEEIKTESRGDLSCMAPGKKPSGGHVLVGKEHGNGAKMGDGPGASIKREPEMKTGRGSQLKGVWIQPN